MPIYEYRCSGCGSIVEVLLSSPNSTARCTRCGAVLHERLLSTPNIGGTIRRSPGHTCCGREERCDTPPCNTEGGCHR